MLQQMVPADPTAPSLGRELVSRFEGTVPHTVLSDARLLISELITNSVRHGHPTCDGIEVGIEVDDGLLRVHVRDQGPGFDAAARYGPRYDSGWGLHLLASIATEWGVEGGRGSSTDAWFALRW